MATQNAVSLELLADSIEGGFSLSRTPPYREKAHRAASGVVRALRGSRRGLEEGAWRHTIQIALPLAGSAVGFALLLGIGLVQG